MRNAILLPSAKTIGPFSHAVNVDGLIFLSGQTGLDSAGKLVEGGIEEQTRRTFENVFAILASAGLRPDDVQKVNVFLTDMREFAAMNAVYKEYFTEPYPARTTLGVTALPLGARVEIEVMARKA